MLLQSISFTSYHILYVPNKYNVLVLLLLFYTNTHVGNYQIIRNSF